MNFIYLSPLLRQHLLEESILTKVSCNFTPGMGKILFIVFPQQSHHNASFRVASLLQGRGHRITFAAVKRMQSSVEMNGFDFVEISNEKDFFHMSQAVTALPNWWRSIIDDIRFTILLKEKLYSTDYFSSLLSSVKPSLVIIDGTYKMFALQLFGKNIPYMFIETTVPTTHDKNIPPLGSSYVPSKQWWSGLYCKALWLVTHLNPFRIAINNIFKKYARRVNLPDAEIDYNRYFVPGYRFIPEINTSFLNFDFPRPRPLNHIHIAPPDIQSRKELAYDYGFLKLIDYLKCHSGKKVVYCSLGTMMWRYNHYDTFLKKLSQIFNLKPGWVLIMCVENERLRRQLRRESNGNVFVFKRVPQLDVLKNYADVMINHGGLNSINECIQTSVPILVCPGSRSLDQYGNAGRIKFHQIGLESSFTDTPKKIHDQIEELLNNACYKDNITSLYIRICNNYNSEILFDTINREIQGQHETV